MPSTDPPASAASESVSANCRACNYGLMVALSPMHPHHYLNAACDEHRRRFVEASPVFADYDPEDWRL